jgi:hypothetical protein
MSETARFQISGQQISLAPEQVENAVRDELPEPIHEHYVIVGGRRFPPKQVVMRVTGLDRADFTTHQARRILKRLGFIAARVDRNEEPREDAGGAARSGPHQGRQAAALAPHVGKWVALAGPTEVLVAAMTPQEVLAWLAKHERRASFGMFRVPEAAGDAEGAAPL